MDIESIAYWLYTVPASELSFAMQVVNEFVGNPRTAIVV